MKRPHSCIVGFATLLLLAVIASPAGARMRKDYGDDEVTSRAELVVVGGIKEGSIKYVAHPHGPGEGASWEHHATLLVHRVLKGKCEEKEIPITLHYGIDPVIDGHAKEATHEYNHAPPAGAAAGYIQLIDSGGMDNGSVMSSADARADNLWYLRRREDQFRKDQGPGNYGISDPEDFQPLALEDYLKCYLLAEPESAVRAQLQKQPEIAARAIRYLEHRAIGRALQTANADQRVEQLLPYYRSRSSGYDEARKGIVAAGTVAGPYLLGVYNSNPESYVRSDIIRIWAEIRWTGCVDLLTAMLKEDDRFWSFQKLEPGWWNTDVDSALTRRRRDVYGEVHSTVYALRQIGDPRAREAVELTRRRWAAIKFENPQILEECDAALKRFAEVATPK